MYFQTETLNPIADPDSCKSDNRNLVRLYVNYDDDDDIHFIRH